MTGSTYLLDNAEPQTAQRFASLEALYDPTTLRALRDVGVSAGWSCWEVGAGGGSVARWLSDAVGPTGTVLATDIDARWFDVSGLGHPSNLTIEVHDVTADPVPVGAFDLVHVRLVLVHLPERDAVLTRLVDSLKPGGWLVVEELDPMGPYFPDPVTDSEHLINRVGEAFTAALSGHGADNARGRRLHRLLAGAGLVDTANEGHQVVAVGGSPAARLMQANTAQVAAELVDRSGLTPADLARYATILDDPETTFYMPVFFTGRGRHS